MANAELGLRIRRARERLHLTQKELADAVGVTGRAVGDWERGVKTPRNRIGALEHVLGVSLALDGAQPDPDEETLMSLDLDPVERKKLLEFYRELRGEYTGRRRNTA